MHLDLERSMAVEHEVRALQNRAALRRPEALSRCAVPAAARREVPEPGCEQTKNERGPNYPPAAAPAPRSRIREHPERRAGERVHDASMTSTTPVKVLPPVARWGSVRHPGVGAGSIRGGSTAERARS